MLNKIIITLLILISVLVDTAFAEFDLSHQKFSNLLKSYVVESENSSTTKVQYNLILNNKHLLEGYLNDLSGVKHSEYRKWRQADKLAFLINTYNAFTIKLILDNYGRISSIKDIGSIFSNPWRNKFFKLFGEKTNLDYVEHGIIRKEFSEPLIHGALVCAAKGCPPLRKEAYRGKTLSSQLNDNMQRFLEDRNKNRYNSKNRSVELSPVFKWYKDDFQERKNEFQEIVFIRNYYCSSSPFFYI